MPHGGYHGNVVIGGNVVQSGNPDGSISGGIDNRSRLDFNPPSGNQNNQNINQQVENKKKEIELLNTFQEGITGGVTPNIDQQVDVIDQGFFPTGIMAGSTTLPAGIAPGATFPITGATGIDAINLAKQQQFKNQQLNNLLQQQQEINLANQLRSTFAKAGTDKADALRPLFTGDLGDKTFFGMNSGSTERPAATVINPFTGEKITTGKVREGMSSPEYAQYMSELYGLNPALMGETFPFGSGQMAKPILARIGEGIMGIPGASEIGQMGGDILGAMISPMSGIFSGKKTTTPKIQYDNMGNPVGIISQLPESDGGDFDINTPKLDLGQYSAIPEEYKGFFESEFAKPVAGGMAITYVTLPDGSKVKFGDTGSAAQFRKYLESIGAIKSESTEDYPEGYGAFLLNPPAPVRPGPRPAVEPPDKDGDGVDDRYQAGPGIPRPGMESVGSLKPKTSLPAAFNYANIAPQFTGSPYTNQGVSPAFLENLRRFYG